jgi:hypothetical protein
MCGNGVLNDPRYIEFMKGFADNVDVSTSDDQLLKTRFNEASACGFVERTLSKSRHLHQRHVQPAPPQQTGRRHVPNSKVQHDALQGALRSVSSYPTKALT